MNTEDLVRAMVNRKGRRYEARLVSKYRGADNKTLRIHAPNLASATQIATEYVARYEWRFRVDSVVKYTQKPKVDA